MIDGWLGALQVIQPGADPNTFKPSAYPQYTLNQLEATCKSML
jgi:hypothetical protein